MRLLIIAPLLIFFSCVDSVELIDTESLGLSGNIERISHYGKDFAKQEIFFDNNKLAQVKVWKRLGYILPDNAYYLEYENDFLVKVHWTNYYKGNSNFSRDIKPEEFKFSFELDEPPINYSYESAERNKNGDLSRITFFDKDSVLMKEWVVTYEYDWHNNWIARKTIEKGEIIEDAKREIIYKSELPLSKVNQWNNALDSLFKIHNERNMQLITAAPRILDNGQSLLVVHEIVSNNFVKVKENIFNGLKLLEEFNIALGSKLNRKRYWKTVEKAQLIHKVYSVEYLLWSELNSITPSVVEQGKEPAISSYEKYHKDKMLTKTNAHILEIQNVEEAYQELLTTKDK